MILQRPGAAPRSRVRIGLGAAVVLLLVGLGVAILVSAFTSAGTSRIVAADPEPSASPSGSPARGSSGAPPATGVQIYIHILGAVAHPGLYQLHDGDRAVDAVAAAGGFTEAADKQQLNLARFVSDGEQIYVPTVDEAASAGPQGATGQSGGPGSVAHGVIGGKVNINTADETTLETLPRVGPAMAQRIIAWRQANGRFASTEDLMSVTGIGEKTFAGLKDLVTV